MASHLRHCPKHRNPPQLLPCKLCALIVVNPAQPAETPPAPEVPPVKKQRGRPPKFDKPMTDAERTRRKREGPEREELIKKIDKRIKTSEHANVEAMKRALAKFQDALDTKSIDDLREIAKAYRIGDTRGRTALEGRTGTAQDDSGEFVPRLENIEAKDYIKRKYGIKPPALGASPDVDELDPMEDAKEPSSSVKIFEHVKDIWDDIPEITERTFIGDEIDWIDVPDVDPEAEQPLCCRVHGCGFRATYWSQAREHVVEMLTKAEKHLKYIRDLREVVDSGVLGYEDALIDAKKAWRDGILYGHYLWIPK